MVLFKMFVHFIDPLGFSFAPNAWHFYPFQVEQILHGIRILEAVHATECGSALGFVFAGIGSQWEHKTGEKRQNHESSVGNSVISAVGRVC